MGSDKFTFEADVLPVVQAWASRSLSSDSDRDAKVNDAVSIAWEIFQTSPDEATPSTIARYAVKRVRSDRTFSESVRSVSSPKRRLGKPERCTFDVQAIWRVGDNPARIVGFRLDYHAWLDTLRPASRVIAELLAAGHTTQQVAEKLGCTEGNVSQYRRRLQTSWNAR